MRPQAKSAAQYLRMSTEHQRYSFTYQSEHNAGFAEANGLQITKTYSDAARSGLHLRGREGLKKLLSDVLGGDPGFEVVLVYDVSRWGRFQDPDQSAHYEFICKSAGVRVFYTAEQFPNDASVVGSLWKQIRRAMAAEYSRDLSEKVKAAQIRVARDGYRLGGIAGLGLRRAMVNERGDIVAILEDGQKKGIQAFRTKLVPGPDAEVALVRRIFHLFAITGLGQLGIARLLQAEGIRSPGVKGWTRELIKGVLTNEKYVGTHVFNRSSQFLGGELVRNPPAVQVVVPNAFDAIVPGWLFTRTQEILASKYVRLSDDEMLLRLKTLVRKKGSLTRQIIEAAPEAPCTETYRKRFGSLRKAYSLIGYDSRQGRASRLVGMSREEMIVGLERMLALRGHLSGGIINGSPDLPSAVTYRQTFGSLKEAFRLAGYAPAQPRWYRRPMSGMFDEQFMLDHLRTILSEHGKVTQSLVNHDSRCPTSSTYRRRFGSLSLACARIGYEMPLPREIKRGSRRDRARERRLDSWVALDPLP